MAEKDGSPLSVSIMRGLTDKLVERRKGAALELERSVKPNKLDGHKLFRSARIKNFHYTLHI